MPAIKALSAAELRLAQTYLTFASSQLSLHTLAHLGQSLDGCIATKTGHAAALTGPENHDHLHRLRAIADAVLIGGGTAAADNPRLTTRLVDGPSPIRLIIDPDARLDPKLDLFHDGAARTIVISTVDGPPLAKAERLVEANPLTPPTIQAIVKSLGVSKLFIEGGGMTVSRFLQAGLVNQLQICVAPILLGQGIRGLDLSSVERINDGLAFGAQPIAQGRDQLFDSGILKLSGQWPALEIEALPHTFGTVGRLFGKDHGETG